MVQLLDEIEERNYLGAVLRIEESDQVRAGDLVAGEVGDERDALVEEAVRTDQPGQRVEALLDLAKDRLGEFADERAEVEGDVGQGHAGRIDREALAWAGGEAEVNENVGRDRGKHVADIGAERTEIDGGMGEQVGTAAERGLDDIAELGRAHLGEGQSAIAIGIPQEDVVAEAQSAEGEHAGLAGIEGDAVLDAQCQEKELACHRRRQRLRAAEIGLHRHACLRRGIGRLVGDEVEALLSVHAEAKVHVEVDRDLGLEVGLEVQGRDAEIDGRSQGVIVVLDAEVGAAGGKRDVAAAADSDGDRGRALTAPSAACKSIAGVESRVDREGELAARRTSGDREAAVAGLIEGGVDRCLQLIREGRDADGPGQLA